MCLFSVPTIVIYAQGGCDGKYQPEPLNPVSEFLTKKQPGCDRTTDHNHGFPHNARPHHARAAQRLYQEEENRHPSQYTEHQVVVLTLIGEPFQVGVAYELGGRHGQYVHKAHPL